MRTKLLVLWFGCSLLFASTCAAGKIFTASLSGDQEVPPVMSSASGVASLELSDDETSLSYSIDVFGLDIGDIQTEESSDNITGLHIHAAPAGINGGVVFGIFRPQHDQDDRFITIDGEGGPIHFEGVWDAPDVINGAAPLADQLMNLFDQGLYFNVHTLANPGGEIRGQIVPEPTSWGWLGLILVATYCSGRRRAFRGVGQACRQ